MALRPARLRVLLADQRGTLKGMDPHLPTRSAPPRPRQFSIRLLLIATAFVATVLAAVRNLHGETLLVVGVVAAGLAWGNLLILVGAFVGALLAYSTSAGPAIDTSHLLITAIGLLLGLATGWTRHRDEVLEAMQADDTQDSAARVSDEGP